MTHPVPFEFAFLSHEPSFPLRRYVSSLWYARGTVPYVREKIAPTGSSVAVFVLGDPIIETSSNGEGVPVRSDRGFLVGPHDRPVINEPTGETFAVGIVCTPVGCETVFGVRPSLVRGRVVELDAIWSDAATLRSCLVAAASPDAMLRLLEHRLAATLKDPPVGIDRCEAAVRMVEDDPVRSIADIADALGVSHGHLDREFTRLVGLSPRALARLLRMNRLLARIDVSADVGWADLAHELGWFDQAHLIRDFKRHTGVTPSRYIAAQRATLSPVAPADAAGFVPET